jgi:protein-disulfide isomerase
VKIKTLIGLLSTSALLFFSSMVFSETEPAKSQFTPEQKTAIENIIEEYLTTKPEVLIKASQVLQQRQQTEMEKQLKEGINKHTSALLSSQASPIAGNAKGKVAVVEFFDYQCIHCKHMSPIVDALIKNNPDVKVIFKEFPIFGENSHYAALAAVAANTQAPEKFLAFHQALMEMNKPLNKDIVLKAAKKAGLNIAKLKADMDAKATKEEVDNNLALASKMGIRFTPVFIITKNPFDNAAQPAVVPGATSKEMLQKMIDKTAKP